MKKQVAALFLAMMLVSSFAGIAEAHRGHWTYVPSFYGTGSVIIDSSTSGRAYVDHNGGNHCIYAQYRGAHKYAVDNSTWRRATPNSCGPAVTGSFSYSDYYHGVRIRLCQDIPYQPDPCGGDITHYAY